MSAAAADNKRKLSDALEKLEVEVETDLERRNTVVRRERRGTVVGPSMGLATMGGGMGGLLEEVAVATTSSSSSSSPPAASSSSSPPGRSRRGGMGGGGGGLSGIEESVAQVLTAQLEHRNVLIQTMKNAYLRDVVLVRDVLGKYVNSETAAENQRIPAVYAEEIASLPSLDLTALLPLFSPEGCSMSQPPCDHCGGAVELVNTVQKGRVDAVKAELEVSGRRNTMLEEQVGREGREGGREGGRKREKEREKERGGERESLCTCVYPGLPERE